MTNIYESELLYKLMERDGLNIPSSVPPYESEIKAYLIEQVKLAYPKLTDYEAEWLLYNYTRHLPAEFPIESITNVTDATVNNVVPYAYKSAILKGNTKYRDIDTGDILDTFDETKNLELVSVKMPVLTTSNEDGTKTNILTVNEEVELRGIGEVQDELNLLTGELIERIGEIVLDGSENWEALSTMPDGFYKARADLKDRGDNFSFGSYEVLLISDRFASYSSRAIPTNHGNYIVRPDNVTYDIELTISDADIQTHSLQAFKRYLQDNPTTVHYRLKTPTIKTVDLSVVDENGNEIKHFMPIEGTMHIQTDGEPIKPSVTMEIPVEATTQNLASFIEWR